MDSDAGIPFSLLREEDNVQLMELPDDLLALLAGDNPQT
jgi:hypothetical protein